MAQRNVANNKFKDNLAQAFALTVETSDNINFTVDFESAYKFDSAHLNFRASASANASPEQE